MSSVNRVILLGRLGTDPESRSTNNGESVCNFSLATTKEWKGKDGQKQTKTEWMRIVAWRKTAELCAKYLKKGHLAYFEGELQTRKWKDKNEVDRYTTEIVVHNVQFISAPMPKTEHPTPQTQSPKDQSVEPQDKIPF